LILVGCLSGLAAQASAQTPGFALNQFRAAETSNDGMEISSPNSLGHLDVGARLSLDYGLNPLVVETRVGDASTEREAIVEHLLSANLGLSVGLFDRVVLYGGLPVTLWSAGNGSAGLPAADGTAAGDPYLGVRVRLLGERSDVFALGIQLGLTFPMGDSLVPAQLFSGERAVTFQPRVMGEIRLLESRFRINLNLGARIREASDLGNLRVGHELTFGAGIIGVVVPDTLDVIAEVVGATGFSSSMGRGGFFGRENTPVEAILGLRVHPACEWEIGLAGGTGISRGYGAADFRGVLQLGFAHDAHCRADAPNGTSVEPDSLEAPRAALAPDSDADGVPDTLDTCASEIEDLDGFRDEDGCLDSDNDGDGVLDTSDGAPLDAEDSDGFEDADGVPELDNDQDGVVDSADGAPLAAEDRDGFQDLDGIPEPDNDGDTVLDGVDQCPLAPGVTEGNELGCPRSIRFDAEAGTIVILERVEFATGRDVILASSFPILEEVRAVLTANPQIARLRIEGHTDDRGVDARNLELSRRRALSVLRWLSGHEVAASRLEAWGCGELHPTQTNQSNEGRQANRRVEFHLLEPVPAGGARALEGCVQAE
jgi:outer membrane protein OmpA-like peptidoglycan-associated protein